MKKAEFVLKDEFSVLFFDVIGIVGVRQYEIDALKTQQRGFRRIPFPSKTQQILEVEPIKHSGRICRNGDFRGANFSGI